MVVFEEQAQIVNAVFQHSDTFNAQTKGKTGHFLGIITAHAQYVGMYNTGAKDFQPAAVLAYMAATLALAGMTLAGCSYHIEHIDPTTDPVVKPFNTFDFSTTNDSVQVNLAYDLQVKAPIYFELYDEEPGAWADNGQYYKREDALPLYAGYTDGEGKFCDKLSLPAYVTRLYAYTPAFIATSIMDAEVNGKSVTFTDPVSTWAGRRSTRAGMAGNTNFS